MAWPDSRLGGFSLTARDVGGWGGGVYGRECSYTGPADGGAGVHCITGLSTDDDSPRPFIFFTIPSQTDCDESYRLIHTFYKMMSTMRLGRTVAKRAFSTTAAARYVQLYPQCPPPLLCPARSLSPLSLTRPYIGVAPNGWCGFLDSCPRPCTGHPAGRPIRMMCIVRSMAGAICCKWGCR